MGRWKDDDQVEESVRFAQTMCDRLELDADTRQSIEFLVAQHLAMAHVAFRSDSEDPAVIQTFAALVGTAERLKTLCVMTLADIQAMGTNTLTPWKEELLWRLYLKTHDRLTLAYGDDVIEHGQAAVAAVQATRPADIGEQELTISWKGFRRDISSRSTARVSTSTRGSRETSIATKCTCSSSRRERVGARGGHPGQAAAVLEHLRHARPISAWTSCAAAR